MVLMATILMSVVKATVSHQKERVTFVLLGLQGHLESLEVCISLMECGGGGPAHTTSITVITTTPREREREERRGEGRGAGEGGRGPGRAERNDGKRRRNEGEICMREREDKGERLTDRQTDI